MTQASPTLQSESLWRVVSETLENEAVTASAGLKVSVTRLNKHASHCADFASLNRGQVVSTGPLATKSVTDRRVQAETPLRILTGKRKSC